MNLQCGNFRKRPVFTQYMANRFVSESMEIYLLDYQDRLDVEIMKPEQCFIYVRHLCSHHCYSSVSNALLYGKCVYLPVVLDYKRDHLGEVESGNDPDEYRNDECK